MTESEGRAALIETAKLWFGTPYCEAPPSRVLRFSQIQSKKTYFILILKNYCL